MLYLYTYRTSFWNEVEAISDDVNNTENHGPFFLLTDSIFSDASTFVL